MIDVQYLVSGDDAFSNGFYVFFFNSLNSLSISSIIGFRVTQLTIPEISISSFERVYKNIKIEIPTGVNGSPKELSMTFRGDRVYSVYQFLRNRVKGMEYSKSGIIEEVKDSIGKNYYFDIYVVADTFYGNMSTDLTFGNLISTISQIAGGLNTKVWVFRNSWISSLGSLSFSVDSGDPLFFEATFKFVKDDILDIGEVASFVDGKNL